MDTVTVMVTATNTAKALVSNELPKDSSSVTPGSPLLHSPACFRRVPHGRMLLQLQAKVCGGGPPSFLSQEGNLLCRSPWVSPRRLRNLPKQGSPVSAPLSKRAFSSVRTLDREDELALPHWATAHVCTWQNRVRTFQPAASRKDGFPSVVLLTFSLRQASLSGEGSVQGLCLRLDPPSSTGSASLSQQPLAFLIRGSWP